MTSVANANVASPSAAASVAAPAVSVLMATYNGREYLSEAMESILGQTFGDFEFIIIDDGSTDGTADLIAEYARRDPRVKLITQPNMGLTRSLNKGIALACGRYLARMDGDDVAMPTRFEKQAAFLDAHPDHVMVGSQVRLIDPDGDPLCDKAQTQYGHQAIETALMEKGWPMVHPAVMVRLDALRDIRGYDERFRTNQDHDLFIRLCERGQVENLPEVLLEYRQHFSSVVFTTGRKQSDVLKTIVREAWARRGKPMPPELESPTGKDYLPLEQYHEWFWTALRAGQRKTARKYALRLLRRRPWSLGPWKMLYRALTGRC